MNYQITPSQARELLDPLQTVSGEEKEYIEEIWGGYVVEKKYSEGPWEWWGDSTLWSVTDDDSVLESDDDGKPYGSHTAMITHHWDKDVKEANKRLIAAAPELLEALIEVVRISDRKHDAWDAAKDAIAKAV